MVFQEKDIQFYQKPGDMSNKSRALHGADGGRAGVPRVINGRFFHEKKTGRC
jgi:hypothetical protein